MQTHAINYEEAYLGVWRAMENNLDITIKNIEEKIINYSKNERLYILITFRIQFIIFSFIQFFELSSLPKIINKKS